MQILNAAKSGARFGGPSFPFSNRLLRFCWQIAWGLLGRWTPPPLHPWRRLLVRLFGGRIGKGARIYGGVRIWLPSNLVMGEYSVLGPNVECYNMAPIRLEPFATVSQDASLYTGSHDIEDPNLQLCTKPVTIGREAWIAAEAFVGPGVTVGEGAVLGARGVAFSDLAPWTVYAGNPAKPIKSRGASQPVPLTIRRN
jgi:putative colanic acid biosynthesis acetyltransferase WcaF